MAKTKKTAPADTDYRGLSEDEIKSSLEKFLKKEGWETMIAWGAKRGIDIDARRGSKRWIIEVKGHGSRTQMRLNYFLSILGEILTRMDDTKAKYSIALPDMERFRTLWAGLPDMAKQRTGISCLFVTAGGKVIEQ
jgi:hypothetical protein